MDASTRVLHRYQFLAMIRKYFFPVLIFISCLKFEFESPYEDLNGIYLQWMGENHAYVRKMIFDEDKTYTLNTNRKTITCYSYIFPDSINTFSSYVSSHTIADFTVNKGFVYMATPSFGLEIINFHSQEPFLYSTLAINDSTALICLNNSCLCLLSSYRLDIVDISENHNPKKLSEYQFQNRTLWMEIDSIYAYVLTTDNTFHIIDIEDPANPILRLQYCNDTMSALSMFTINKEFVYFLKQSGSIDIYETVDATLVFQTSISAPDFITYMAICGNYGIAISSDMVFLLNLKYPTRPSICEALKLPVNWYLDYGLVNDKTIYASNDIELHFIAIREIPR